MAANNAAYIGFTRALTQMFDNAGVEYQRDSTTDTGVLENAKWVDFQFRLEDGSMHKLYVPKNKGTVGKCHTTIQFAPSIEGVLELPSTERRPEYRNGAIRSHLSGADPERVAKLVIAALRRGAPVPQKRAAQPRQQAQAPQREVSEQDIADDAQGMKAQKAPAARESWTVTEDDIGQVEQELSQAGS